VLIFFVWKQHSFKEEKKFSGAEYSKFFIDYVSASASACANSNSSNGACRAQVLNTVCSARSSGVRIMAIKKCSVSVRNRYLEVR
jgi:hypothetical protein